MFPGANQQLNSLFELSVEGRFKVELKRGCVGLIAVALRLWRGIAWGEQQPGVSTTKKRATQ